MTLLSVSEIQNRLQLIFPEGTEQRVYLIREMAAKTIFVCLYANAIEGAERWIRPNQVCRMTDEQAAQVDTTSRNIWYVQSGKQGFVPNGSPWFADTTREPIRDETIREGLIPVRAIIQRLGVPTTSSKGRYALQRDFANLFDYEIRGKHLDELIGKWRETHLSKTALARQALVASGALISDDLVQVTFPNGETRHLSVGPSSIYLKQ